MLVIIIISEVLGLIGTVDDFAPAAEFSAILMKGLYTMCESDKLRRSSRTSTISGHTFRLTLRRAGDL